jgi:hypothetical protein
MCGVRYFLILLVLLIFSFSFNLPHQSLTAVWCYYFAYKFYLRLEVSARQNNRHQAAKTIFTASVCDKAKTLMSNFNVLRSECPHFLEWTSCTLVSRALLSLSGQISLERTFVLITLQYYEKKIDIRKFIFKKLLNLLVYNKLFSLCIFPIQCLPSILYHFCRIWHDVTEYSLLHNP